MRHYTHSSQQFNYVSHLLTKVKLAVLKNELLGFCLVFGFVKVSCFYVFISTWACLFC